MTMDVTLELLVEEDNSDSMVPENALQPVVVAVHNVLVVAAVVEELIHDWKEFRQYSKINETK